MSKTAFGIVSKKDQKKQNLMYSMGGAFNAGKDSLSQVR